MPRRPKLEVIETPRGFKVDVPKSLAASGKRERFFYQDPKQAKKHAAGILKAYHERGTQAGTISPALASAATEAEKRLEPFGVSLLEAVQDYVNRYAHQGAAKTIDEAWTTYEALLLKNGRADATIEDYKRDRRSLPEWFFKLKAGEATSAKIEAALDESTRNRGKSWNRKLREVKAVLNEALRTSVKPTTTKRKDPVILSVEESTKIMALAVADGCALPFALMLFAGVRPKGEINRISWGSLRGSEILISSEDSKTDDERHIPISANLKEWLKVCEGDDIIPERWAKRYQAIRKAVGITDQDVLRHTFGSSFYRLHGDAEAVRAMGHTSFNTLRKFYLRSVTKEAAEEFFAITPEGVQALPTIQPVVSVAQVGG